MRMKLQPIKKPHLLRYQPGDRAGCFTVIQAIGAKHFKRGVSVVFEVRCDCGSIWNRDRQTLIRNPKACDDCRFPGSMPPGSAYHPLYPRWQGMIDRCTNPSNSSFKNYGGRGIAVCERWTTGEGRLTGFECFLLDMGEPKDGETIERENNDGDYAPANCSWQTRTIQSRNRRSLRMIEHNGETHPVSVWAERIRMPYFTLMRRIKAGWSVEDALTRPLRK